MTEWRECDTTSGAAQDWPNTPAELFIPNDAMHVITLTKRATYSHWIADNISEDITSSNRRRILITKQNKNNEKTYISLASVCNGATGNDRYDLNTHKCPTALILNVILFKAPAT